MSKLNLKYLSFLIIITVLTTASPAISQNINTSPTQDSVLLTKPNLAKNAEYFSKGIENKYNENYDVAIEYFENALKFFPDDDASMYELSELYNLKGMYSEAFTMIQKAVKLKPDNKWYQIRLAGFYKQNNDYEALIRIYDKLIENEPNNLEYLEIYIDALLNLGLYDKVIDKLNVFEENIGVNEYISLEKAKIYKLLGNNDKAIEEIKHLSAAYPYEIRYLSMLAELYMQNGQEKDAYNIYLKIKELSPEDPYINISLLEYYQKHGEIDKAYQEFILSIKNKNLDYNTKTRIYEYWFQNKGDNVAAAKEAEEAGKAFIETHPDKEIGYYIIGTVYYNDKMYDKAQEMYLEAIKRDSTSFITWYQLGFTDTELKDNYSLRNHSEKALRFYPEQPIFYLLNGLSYFNEKEYENAIKVFENGVLRSADKKLIGTFNVYIADSYHELGNKEKMYEYYEKVIKNDPENIYVLNNYAYYLSLDNKDLEKALKMSGKTIEAEPKNVIYIDTYAWVLYKLGRYKEAKNWMEKVFSYKKTPEGINYEHYGDILYKLGDTKKAVLNWKKAKKLGNTSKFIDQKIKDETIYE